MFDKQNLRDTETVIKKVSNHIINQEIQMSNVITPNLEEKVKHLVLKFPQHNRESIIQALISNPSSLVNTNTEMEF